MKTRFLNSDVEREVMSNPTLFVAWALTIDTVDDEIDPTHRPTWVAQRQENERKHLVELKNRIAGLLELIRGT